MEKKPWVNPKYVKQAQANRRKAIIMNTITPKHMLIIVGVVASILGLSVIGQLFETNNAGYMQVKQAAGSGDMSVRTEPGVYVQAFANITTYKISDVYDFNSERIDVTFGDSSTANISGQIKYILPSGEEQVLQINREFRSDENIQQQLIRQVVASVLRQTASMFNSEDVYSTRRSDFINLVNEQIKNGIYATTYTEALRKDEDGNTFLQRQVTVKRDEQGRPYISEPSSFKRYGVEVIQLVINNIDFDDTTKGLIVKRKEAEQERVVAKSKAERAKQDAITAEAQGKANVALAEAEALVDKKRAVIAAEKEKEVAQQEALKAEEEKKAIVARGQAEAEAARLKVQAGLTPLDKANIEKETAIGVAEKLATIKFPEMMVIGGSGNGSAMNPFDAVGLESFIKISKNLANSKE